MLDEIIEISKLNAANFSQGLDEDNAVLVFERAIMLKFKVEYYLELIHTEQAEPLLQEISNILTQKRDQLTTVLLEADALMNTNFYPEGTEK